MCLNVLYIYNFVWPLFPLVCLCTLYPCLHFDRCRPAEGGALATADEDDPPLTSPDTGEKQTVIMSPPVPVKATSSSCSSSACVQRAMPSPRPRWWRCWTDSLWDKARRRRPWPSHFVSSLYPHPPWSVRDTNSGRTYQTESETSKLGRCSRRCLRAHVFTCQ